MPDFSISAVIPSYNRISTLSRALDSVYSQTRAVDEVIVVDDGSDDDTASFVATHFPQVLLISQKNEGVSAARNRGAKAARSRWLAFLDSDDAWLPEKIEKQVAALEKNPERRICHTEERWVFRGKEKKVAKAYRKRDGWIFEQCLPRCAICPSSVLIRKELLQDLGGFDPEFPFCEDYDLWLRICSRYPTLLVDEPLVEKHGGHADQLSNQRELDRYRIFALKKLLEDSLLSSEKRLLVAGELSRKCKVYAAGLEKHGRQGEALQIRSIALDHPA